VNKHDEPYFAGVDCGSSVVKHVKETLEHFDYVDQNPHPWA